MNEWNTADLIERTWREFNGEVPRSRIREVVNELLDGYQDAKVKTYLPILIRRQAIDLLNAERGTKVNSFLQDI
jgi:hypothetical protein